MGANWMQVTDKFLFEPDYSFRFFTVKDVRFVVVDWFDLISSKHDNCYADQHIAFNPIIMVFIQIKHETWLRNLKRTYHLKCLV